MSSDRGKIGTLPPTGGCFGHAATPVSAQWGRWPCLAVAEGAVVVDVGAAADDGVLDVAVLANHHAIHQDGVDDLAPWHTPD